MEKNTYLITGASDGIGKAIALELGTTDSTLVLHGRNAEKLQMARDEIRDRTGSQQLHMVIADFASLEQVAALAEQVAQDFSQLNILINNAGHLTDHWQSSCDGFELTFAVNYLAPYLLTRKLLSTLIANAPSRIVNVSSTAMGGGFLDFSDLQSQQRFDGWQAYSNSKLAIIYFSHLLAEQLRGTKVISNSLCPGLIDTNFMHTNNVFGSGAYERMRPIMRPSSQGADVPMYLATAQETAEISGEFFIRDSSNEGDKGKVVPLRWDHATAEKLWSVSNDLVAAWL